MYKIYLAGKIRDADWRDEIVKVDHKRGGEEWREQSKYTPLIFGKFQYVGPFPQEQHGDIHAVQYEDTSRLKGSIVDNCLRAIDSADIVFVWLTEEETHGSIFELGYAHAKGKLILLGAPTNEVLKKWWFASNLTSPRGGLVWGTISGSPKKALETELIEHGKLSPLYEYTWESKLEEKFAAAVHNLPESFHYQYSIGSYRIDFAHVESKVAVELDGKSYHDNDNSFESDRRRDRYLASKGWVTVRFTGKEILSDVRGCVRQVREIIKERSENA